MQFRDHPAVSGKRDFYPVDPLKIKVDPGFNVRDLATPDALEKLRELKNSIIANGVRVPLEVRLAGEDLFVVSGHRRLAAVLQAIKEGHEIKTVPVIPEQKGVNVEERTLNLVIANSGEPLTALETATVCKRLLDFGWSDAQISTRLGWKSTQQVHNLLQLLGADPAVREMVRQGEVSATTAIKTVRENGLDAVKTLKAAKKIANSQGKTRVTDQHLKPSKKQVLKAVVEALQKIYKLGEEESCKIIEDVMEEYDLW